MSKYEVDASKITGESFTFIACYFNTIRGQYQISNIKGMTAMTKEKGIGTMIWWRKTMCEPKYPCFIYDIDVVSLFLKNGKQNKKVIEKLILDQGGELPK